MSKSWLPLKDGDTIQVIAPSSKFLDPTHSIDDIKSFLESWKLRPLISKSIIEDNLYSDLANTDEKRFADLKNALLNPEVKAIWCLRGGYGAIRLLPYLKELKEPSQAKLFIGFSDITFLHIYFQQQWGWPVIHGPVAIHGAYQKVNASDISSLKQIMFGELTEIIINDLEPLNDAAKKTATINSSLIGGNLTLVTRTLGTPYQINIQDKILVLEDIGEPFRKVDAMLRQLELTGAFEKNKKPKAIILGDFSFSDLNQDVQTLQRQQIDHCLQEFSRQSEVQNIPVLGCYNIGHGTNNHPLPLGPEAKLILGKKPMIKIKTGHQ